MDIKKTAKGWEYGGLLFKDEKSVQLTKQADEDATHANKKSQPMPAAENFQLAYDGFQAKSFGKFIEKVLKERDISLTRLAKDLGVSRPTLYAWMSGMSVPSELNLDKILLVTKAKPEEVFHALSDNFEGYKENIRQKLFDVSKVSGH